MRNKNLSILAVLCVFVSTFTGCKTVRAQTPPTASYVVYQSNVPSGPCTYPNYLTVVNASSVSSGGLYQCKGAPLTWTVVASAGVQSIDNQTGDFTFTGPGVSHTGTTYTFTGAGSGIAAITWSLPAWLTASPSTISASGTQTFMSATGQTANSFLATPSGSTGALSVRAIVPADIPTLNQNTTGTAANLSGTPALPNGTTAATQPNGDNSTKIATTAFVLANGGGGGGGNISGLTTGQVGIAGSATSLTSSKPLAGTASAITTGPTLSVSGNIASFGSTSGSIADSGVAVSSIASFPGTNGVVYNTSVAAARNATNNDITLLLGPTLYAQNFSGADAGAKINACNAAAVAAGGGTCDDTAVLTLTSTATAQVNIGDPISPPAGGNATVRHIFPPQFGLRVTLHDSTQCAVRVFNRGILDGQGLGGGGSRADIVPGAGSTMQALLCTDTSNSNAQNYSRIWGVSAVNDNGSTMNYAVDIESLADQSVYAYSYANNPTGNTMLIGNVCCGMTITGLQAFGSNLTGTPNSTGGRPLSLEGYGYVTISNSTFNRPVNGQPNIAVNGYWQLRLESDYMEGNGTTDSTTPMVNIGTLSTGFSSIDTETNPCFTCGVITKPAYRNQSGYNWALITSITGGQPGTGVAMLDSVSGRTYASAGERNLNPDMHGGPGVNYFDFLNANQLNGQSSTIAALTLSGVTGSTQCLHVNSAGLVSGTGSDCGAGGGGGNTTSTSLTSNRLPKANGTNSIINSLLSDDGTTLTYTGTGGVAAASITGTNTAVNAYFEADRAASGDVLPGSPAANGVTYTVNGGLATLKYSDGSTSTIPKTAVWNCQPGIGDGLNAVPSGTYLQYTCQNSTGKTITLSNIACLADAGASTVNVTNSAGTGLLTAAVTCGTSYTSGTQSGTTTIAANDYLKFTIVGDGTSKQINISVTGTRPW